MSLSALRSDTIRKNGVYKKRYLLKGYLFDRTFRPLITLGFARLRAKRAIPVNWRMFFSGFFIVAPAIRQV